MLQDLTIHEFLNELSSNSPAPGGGSVAALSAALGCALNSMVFNLTVGKKKYNEYSEEKQNLINDSLENSVSKMKDFIEFMEEDTNAFMNLMKAYKLRKETDDEKIYRGKMIKEAGEEALRVPLDTARKVYEIYDDIVIACKYGNKNAVSDAGVAALMIQSALESAILNVRINIAGMNDEKRKTELNDLCDKLVNEGRDKRDKILDEVIKTIG